MNTLLLIMNLFYGNLLIDVIGAKRPKNILQKRFLIFSKNKHEKNYNLIF